MRSNRENSTDRRCDLRFPRKAVTVGSLVGKHGEGVTGGDADADGGDRWPVDRWTHLWRDYWSGTAEPSA
jgi:hypothetical protein